MIGNASLKSLQTIKTLQSLNGKSSLASILRRGAVKGGGGTLLNMSNLKGAAHSFFGSGGVGLWLLEFAILLYVREQRVALTKERRKLRAAVQRVGNDSVDRVVALREDVESEQRRIKSALADERQARLVGERNVQDEMVTLRRQHEEMQLNINRLVNAVRDQNFEEILARLEMVERVNIENGTWRSTATNAVLEMKDEINVLRFTTTRALEVQRDMQRQIALAAERIENEINERLRVVESNSQISVAEVGELRSLYGEAMRRLGGMRLLMRGGRAGMRRMEGEIRVLRELFRRLDIPSLNERMDGIRELFIDLDTNHSLRANEMLRAVSRIEAAQVAGGDRLDAVERRVGEVSKHVDDIVAQAAVLDRDLRALYRKGDEDVRNVIFGIREELEASVHAEGGARMQRIEEVSSLVSRLREEVMGRVDALEQLLSEVRQLSVGQGENFRSEMLAIMRLMQDGFSRESSEREKAIQRVGERLDKAVRSGLITMETRAALEQRIASVELRYDTSTLADIVSDVQGELNDVRGLVGDVRRQVNDHESRVGGLQERLVELGGEVDDVRRRGASMLERVGENEEAIRLVRHDFDDVSRAAMETRAGVDRVSSRLDGVDEMVGDVRRRVGVSERRAEDTDERISGLGERVGLVEDGLDGVRGSVHDFEGRLGSFEGRVDDATMRVDDFDRRVGDAAERISGVGERVGLVEDGLNSFGVRMDNFKDDLLHVNGSMDGLTGQVGEFGDRLDGFESVVGGMGDRVRGLEENVEGLGRRVGRVEDVGERVDGFGGRLDLFNDRVSGVENGLDVLRGGVEDAGERFDGVARRVDDFGHRFDLFDDRVSSVEGGLDVLWGRVDDFDERVSGAEGRVSGVESGMGIFGDRLAVAEDEITNVKDWNIGLQNGVRSMEKNLNKLDRRVDAAEKELRNVPGTINEMRRAIAGAVQASGDVRGGLDQVWAALNSLEANGVGHGEMISSLSAHVDVVERDGRANSDLIQALRTGVSLLENRVGVLDALDQRVSALSELDVRFKSLSEEVDHVRSGLSSDFSGLQERLDKILREGVAGSGNKEVLQRIAKLVVDMEELTKRVEARDASAVEHSAAVGKLSERVSGVEQGISDVLRMVTELEELREAFRDAGSIFLEASAQYKATVTDVRQIFEWQHAMDDRVSAAAARIEELQDSGGGGLQLQALRDRLNVVSADVARIKNTLNHPDAAHGEFA